jgi:drug/metabolite transporter (DMT)-like permease
VKTEHVRPIEAARRSPTRTPYGPRSLLPAAAALTSVLLWASAFVAIRHVATTFSPGALALGRLAVGSVVLSVATGLQAAASPRYRRRWPSRRNWLSLVACGLLWFGVYNVALNAGERRVDAGTAAMLAAVGPILLAILAGLFLGEGFPRRLLAGSVVALAGVLVIGAATSSRSGADSWGVVLCVVAAAAYAVAVVAQKPLVSHLPAVKVTWLACLIGAVGCLPFADDLTHEAAVARPAAIAWMVYLGALPTALAFTTWAYALSRTSAGRLGASLYLVPPLAIVMGWWLLGETPAPLAFCGGALCLCGVWLAQRTAGRRLTLARAAHGDGLGRHTDDRGEEQ